MDRSNPPKKDPKKTGFIIAFGAMLMIGGHYLWWNVISPAMESNAPPPAGVVEQVVRDEYEPPQKQLQPIENEQVFEDIFAEMINEIATLESMAEPDIDQPQGGAKKAAPVKPDVIKQKERSWPADAALDPSDGRTGKVVIIIDDMGMGYSTSNQTIDLPAPLTLAFLPYAPNLEAMTSRAKDRGHELMIHMPMEPMNPDLDVGSIALLDDMTRVEIQENLEKAFASFDGYVGINNHMGSRLTQNEVAMHLVMNELAERGLLFVDSKTISTSVAGRIAAEHGLDYAERDIFLDHENTPEFVMNALRKVEQTAKRQGYAIAIGHPKKATIEGLRQWLPTLEAKGLTVVPVSAVVKKAKLASSQAVVAKVKPAAGVTKAQSDAVATVDKMKPKKPVKIVAEPLKIEEPHSQDIDDRFMLSPLPLE